MNCPRCQAPLDAKAFDDGVEVDFCPQCSGVWYDLADMAVSLRATDVRETELACPRDGRPLVEASAAGSDLRVDRCRACGGVWLDAGEANKLRAALGVDKLIGKGRAQEAPPLPRPGASSAKPAQPEREKRREKPKGAKTPEPRDGGYESNPDESRAPVAQHGGRRYAHFQSSWPKVRYVLGEFPWRVEVGDEARTRDFIHPPFLLSQEVTGSDRTWSHGVYLEPSEVWAGFALPGAPPEPRGAAPAQPNPHEASWRAMWPWACGALVAAAALFAFLAMSARNTVVFRGEYALDPAAAEKAVVTPEFDLPGRPASVRVRIETNVSNSWAFFRLALVNAETDAATHFEREVSYYWGSEDGESWSEGSRNDTVYLSRVPGGRYYLLVDPEASAGVSYNIEVTRDVPRALHLFVACALLALPFAWVWARRHQFEVARWAESDHPVTSSEDYDE